MASRTWLIRSENALRGSRRIASSKDFESAAAFLSLSNIAHDLQQCFPLLGLAGLGVSNSYPVEPGIALAKDEVPINRRTGTVSDERLDSSAQAFLFPDG